MGNGGAALVGWVGTGAGGKGSVGCLILGSGGENSYCTGGLGFGGVPTVFRGAEAELSISGGHLFAMFADTLALGVGIGGALEGESEADRFPADIVGTDDDQSY